MRFVVAGVLFAVAVGLQIRSIIVFRSMMDAVNRAIPAQQRIPEFGPSWLRGKVINAHRRLYPDSDLRRKLYGYWWAETAAFIGALACVVRCA
jgi:hypothetical protein